MSPQSPPENQAEFCAALWIGAFPDELDELAVQFFTRFRPTAKA